LKYLEELSNGECFIFESSYWILTSDFKSNGKKLCYNLNSGSPRWIDPTDIVDLSPIYVLDKENNVIPIKEYKNVST
jgi:hypothetical protein